MNLTPQGLENKREKLLGETKKLKRVEHGKKTNKGQHSVQISQRKGGKKQNNKAVERMLNSEEEGTGGSNSILSTSDHTSANTTHEAKGEEVRPSLCNVFPTLRKRGGSKAATRGTRGG